MCICIERSVLYSPRLHLFDKKYSKNRIIMIFLIYIQM